MAARTEPTAGMPTTSARVPEHLRRHLVFWAAWFAAYGVLGGLIGWSGMAMFHDTVDHIDALWVKLAFLNVPLQLALVVITLLCAAGQSPASQRATRMLASAVSTLIAIHIAISVVVQLQR